MKTIAVIDDDESIGNMLEELLHYEGYSVLRAYSGTEAILLLSQKHPDLILLDLMLPGISGEEVLKHISEIPVIVLSAKFDIDSKVKVLLGGAVDYITKPFDTNELLARITAHLRNTASYVKKSNIKAAGLELDTNSHTVSFQNNKLHLTRTEYAILKLFMENTSQVLSKNNILEHISQDTPDCTESSLKVHISNLRQKLNSISGKDHIESIWGIGFKFG